MPFGSCSPFVGKSSGSIWMSLHLAVFIIVATESLKPSQFTYQCMVHRVTATTYTSPNGQSFKTSSPILSPCGNVNLNYCSCCRTLIPLDGVTVVFSSSNLSLYHVYNCLYYKISCYIKHKAGIFNILIV